MARKREVPFITGKIEIWAAAVVHALGTINFLFDKDTKPYIPVSTIFEHFNTKQSTTSQKSKKIRDMFNMSYFDSTFTIEAINERNPFNNLTTVDGFIVPKDLIEKPEALQAWEIRIAEIIDSPLLKNEYSGEERFQLLEVTEKRILNYYAYLQNRLTFPFRVTNERQVGLFLIEEHIDYIQLEQEMKVHDLYGILVESIEKKKKIFIPLAEMNLDEKHENFTLVNDYQNWFWNYQ